MSAAAILQAAIFERIASDNQLAVRLYAEQRDAALPRISFDGIRSRYFDDSADMETHEFGFSVWDEVQASARAATLSTRLSRRFTQPLSLSGYHVINFLARESVAKSDSHARLWRVQSNFTLVTQKL